MSRAELESYFLRKAIDFDFFFSNGNTVIFDIKRLDPLFGNFLDELGGSIKSGIIFGKGNQKYVEKEVRERVIQQAVLNTAQERGHKKFLFGFSVYGTRAVSYINRLGISIKKELQQQEISARFVTSKAQELSSVVVRKNHLTEGNNIEIVFIKDEDSGNCYIGRTVSAQDFESYSSRDYGRPARDAFKGMLPPKLAQIMINIAGKLEDARMLDPFCGSGTILQEAYLMGYKDVWGSDISEKAIEDTMKNLEWLSSHRDIKAPNLKNIFVYDASAISSRIKPKSIDAIVTEPFLGPALSGRESLDKLKTIQASITDLYVNALLELKKILKKNGRIVMVWPVFFYKKESLYIGVNKQLEEIGLKSIMNDSKTGRTSLMYKRDNQKVGREIWVLEHA